MTTTLKGQLLDEHPEGQRFLDDICGMLTAIATKAGGHLAFVTTPDGTRHASCTDGLAAILESEVGVHRAQVVPEAVPEGRIVTVEVAVEIGSQGPTSSVVKTYNYPQGRVTRHETGERLNLAAVLAGEELR